MECSTIASVCPRVIRPNLVSEPDIFVRHRLALAGDINPSRHFEVQRGERILNFDGDLLTPARRLVRTQLVLGLNSESCDRIRGSNISPDCRTVPLVSDLIPIVVIVRYVVGLRAPVVKRPRVSLANSLPTCGIAAATVRGDCDVVARATIVRLYGVVSFPNLAHAEWEVIALQCWIVVVCDSQVRYVLSDGPKPDCNFKINIESSHFAKHRQI